MLKGFAAIAMVFTMWGAAQAAPLDPPGALSPQDDAKSQLVNPILQWDAPAGALSYHIQVSTRADFTTFARNDSDFTETFRAAGPLKNNTRYYWHVRAKNATGVSAYTVTRSFTTIVEAPAMGTLAAPAATEMNVALSPILLWHKQADISSYRIQISTTADFSATVRDDSVSDTTWTPAALLSNTTYYWHVRAKNIGGVGAYSATWSFTTVPALPAVPALLLPVDKAMQQPVPLTFSWHKADRAATYRLQVSATAGFAALLLDTLVKVDTTVAFKDLAFAKTYYWHVRAGNPGGITAYTDAHAFSTLEEPPVPVLNTPADAAVDLPVTLKLVWNKSVRAVSYRLQVSTVASFATTVFNDTLTDTAKMIGPLANKTAYYWRVNAKNAAGTSEYAAYRKFTTIVLIVPPAPVLASPADGLTGLSPTPVLKWHPSERATGYRVQVSTSPTFATLAFQDSALTDTAVKVASLGNDDIFYWRVSAKNAAGAGTYSEIRSFTTLVAVAALPVAVFPADNALDVPAALTMVWRESKNADSYRLQISAHADFSAPVVDDSTLSDTTRSVGPLAYGTIYYWHVRAKNAAGVSEYTAARKFTVVLEAPIVPILVSPADNAEKQKLNLKLIWKPVSKAISYRVQVSTTATFSSTVLDDSTAADTTKALADLKAGTLYFWRVRAKNAGGVSAFSEIHSFQTEPATALRNPGDVKAESVAVLPGSSARTGLSLEISVPNAAWVRITLINPVNGKTYELVNRNLEAGIYRMPAANTIKSGGIFVLRMEAGAFRETRKIFIP